MLLRYLFPFEIKQQWEVLIGSFTQTLITQNLCNEPIPMKAFFGFNGFLNFSTNIFHHVVGNDGAQMTHNLKSTYNQNHNENLSSHSYYTHDQFSTLGYYWYTKTS